MITLETQNANFEEKAVKNDFPVLARMLDGNNINYLDSAATTLKPHAVISAITKYYSETGANIHRGKHLLSEEASVAFEEARYTIARFIGCAGNEVVFVKNTTEALNLLANGLDLSKNDQIIISADAHHSNFLPWLNRSRVSFIKNTPSGDVDLDHYQSLLKLKPRLVALTHCSNTSGLYIPLQKMTNMAKEAGALVVVDAAQSAPHRQINLYESGIDYIACSAHKMLGPTGVGTLCGPVRQLEQLNPMLLGGGMVDWVENDSYRTRKIPHRLEAGTPHIAGVLGWAEAVRYLEKTGMEYIKRHDLRLGEVLLQEAVKREYLGIVSPGKEQERAGLISVYIPEIKKMGDIARMMSDSYGIMCRSGHMCSQQFLSSISVGEVLRASCYIYNTEADVYAFFKALDEIYQIL